MTSTPLPPADLHLSIGAHALHALPIDEAALFERHLTECEACAEELGGLRAAAALLGAAEARRPPAALRDRVLAAAANTPQDPPLLSDARAERAAAHRVSWYRRPVGWLAAAAAVVVIGGGVTWGVLAGREAPPAAGLEQCVAGDQAVATLTPSVGTGGSLVRSDSCHAALVKLPAMPAPPTGKAYQLWMINGTQPTSMGMVKSLDGETVPLPIADGDRTVAVTVEPAGGSTQPTGQPIWAVPLH